MSDEIKTEKQFKRSLALLAKLPGAIIKSEAMMTVYCAAFNLVLTLPMKMAWNYVMPAIFGLPQIGFIQMFCLLFLLCGLWKITPIVIDTAKI